MTEIELRTTVADGIARVMLDHPPPSFARRWRTGLRG